jgi:amino acid transporter
VHPQLAALYLSRFFDDYSWITDHIIVLAFVLFVGGVNLCGLNVVAASQAVAFVVAVFPCLAFTVLGLPRLRPTPLRSISGPTDGALLLSWSLWLYSGFSSLGSVAGEVAKPRRTYPVVVAILLPLVTLLNLLFFMVSISLDPNRENYTAGYFGVLAGQMAGEWLQTAFTIGAPPFTPNPHSQLDCLLFWVLAGSQAPFTAKAPIPSPPSPTSPHPLRPAASAPWCILA